MIGEAVYRHLATRLRKIASAGMRLDGGTARNGLGDTLWSRCRQWLSVPLATAAAASLMAVLLAIDVVGRIEPTALPAKAGPTATADLPPTPVDPASSTLPAQAANGPDHGLEVELMLAAMPEPAAGPAGAPAATSRLPVVPEVPPELDDIARELQRRRAEVLELEAGLALREAALRAAEADLSTQIDRLEAFRRQLEALVGEAEADEEERLQQLVKMYESMRAKSAAAIFDRLEMPVILSVAMRMREARMAAILAAMDPDRARVVTSELARERELPRLN